MKKLLQGSAIEIVHFFDVSDIMRTMNQDLSKISGCKKHRGNIWKKWTGGLSAA